MEYSTRGGIDEQTLEIRAVDVTISDIGDALMLPELLNQNTPIRRSLAIPQTGPMTHANVSQVKSVATPKLTKVQAFIRTAFISQQYA